MFFHAIISSFLRNKTKVDRIQGADTAALEAKVDIYDSETF